MQTTPALEAAESELTSPLMSPSSATGVGAKGRLSLLDDPQEWPVFGRERTTAGAGAPSWESHVVLDGMHCAACALTIEQALCAVPGVLEAQVNAATRRARVVWLPDVVKPSQWIQSVQKAGYEALPARDAFVVEMRQRESRRDLWRWLVAGFCMMQVMMYAVPAYVAGPGEMTADVAQLLRWASWVICLPVVLFSCGPFFASAWRDVRQRRVSMDLPVALGMLVTFLVSSAGTFDPQGPLGQEVYFDSLSMFVFFLLTGRWLEARLRHRTAGALDALMNRMPDSVEKRTSSGVFERVSVRRLALGDVVRILPGEGVPVDGVVLAGETWLDEALLSGESVPVQHGVGSSVIAGSHNLSAPIEVRVDKLGGATRFAEIVALMEQSSLQKPRLALLADRWARPFLLFVLLAALGAGVYWWPSDHGHALMVAVAVLIVTCPCALSLATPAAMLAAAGVLAQRGVLVRNLQALEALAAVDTVVFDKTGTLTRDGMRVEDIVIRPGFSETTALVGAATLASHSLHPVSKALVGFARARGLQWLAADAVDLTEAAGQGLEARLCLPMHKDVPTQRYRLGSASWCGVPASQVQMQRQEVYLADENGWLATFVLQEDVREDAGLAVQGLLAAGMSVSLMSGDRPSAVAQVAAQVGITQMAGGCSPADKLARLQQLQAQGRHVAMVGDGLNDGPVLAGAHVSFAFGSAVPLTQARSDFVVPGGQLSRIPEAIVLARRTLAIVRQNLIWAAAYNAVCVPLAMVGWLPAWLAGLGMALSSLLVVLNAARLSLFSSSMRGA